MIDNFFENHQFLALFIVVFLFISYIAGGIFLLYLIFAKTPLWLLLAIPYTSFGIAVMIYPEL